MAAKHSTAAVAYLRVATGSARKREQSICIQRQAIARYATIHSLRIARWFADHDCIADIDNRQGLHDAMQFVASGKANVLMVADVSRITRSHTDLLRFADPSTLDLRRAIARGTVLCGGASALVQAGFETLVEAGYQPEMAYFECLHELKLICDLMYESGIAGMRFSISETAKYGDITRGPRIIGKQTKAEMKKILKEIQTGKFTRQWVNEYKGGLKKYNALLKKGEKHQIEKTGSYLRSMMPWMTKKNIKGVQASYS